MDRISVDRSRENVLHKSAQIRHGILMQIEQKEWWKSNWNKPILFKREYSKSYQKGNLWNGIWME